MRILVTNMTLHTRSGSAVSTLELAVALGRRGHEVAVYSPMLGSVADELGESGVPAVEHFGALPWTPDLIHGHHHVPTVEALLNYSSVPGLFVCRDPLAWHDTPPSHPRLVAFVGIDRACTNRLAREVGAGGRVSMIRHGFDLSMLPPRAPLPSRPGKALIYSNNAWGAGWADEIRKGCASLGITTDTVGLRNGNPAKHAGEILGQYDVVFARGRSALEAAAIGAFVIVCDETGAGPALTRETIADCWTGNCGHELLADELTETVVRVRLDRYAPSDAVLVRDYVREHGRMDTALDNWEALYDKVVSARPLPDFEAERLAYLRGFSLLSVAERNAARNCWRLEREIEEASLREAALARELQAFRAMPRT